ncbi:MAG: HAD family hydrolase [Alphaproteobacteria bacterium]|nr:HAD family hydrolase [Alphaproteobacteria bacterium]
MNIFLPRAVIFDWDNTLVDSWGAISEAINFVRARYGLPTWNRQEVLANCTRSARESFPDWFGDKWQTAREEFYDHFGKVRQRAGIHPTDGAVDLLAWLYESKIPALVVSNKSGHVLREEAVQIGWTNLFASIVGAGDAARDKPAREHADRALTLAGLQAGADILFIGDSESDVLCARNADCTPFLIGTQEEAQKLKVALFAADCGEVLERLSKLYEH